MRGMDSRTTGAKAAVLAGLGLAAIIGIAHRYVAAEAKEEAAARSEDSLYEAREWEQEVKQRDRDADLYKGEHAAYVEVAKDSVARGRSAAEFSRNAAAAIGTLYAGAIGVAFATDVGATPLPVRGLIPAGFLGLALMFSTMYVAFLLPGGRSSSSPPVGNDLVSLQSARLDAFVQWTSEIATRNAWALHASVLSLGAGVAFLPSAFLSWEGSTLWIAAAATCCGLLATAIWTGRRVSTGPLPPLRWRVSPQANSVGPDTTG